MVRVQLKGVHRVRGKGGEYHYLFRGGPRFWRSADGEVGGLAYMAAYALALAEREAAKPAASDLTTEAAIDRFLSSPEFTGKRERTRADYRLWAERFKAEFGELAVSEWEDPRSRRDLIAWRNGWGHSPKQADYAITVAVLVLNWAVENDALGQHHCHRVRKLYSADRADILWTPADVEAFMRVAPLPARRILTVSLETGLRPGDVIRLSRQHVEPTKRGRRILMRTDKTRRLASIPVSIALGEVIDATPKSRPLILLSHNGRPLTINRASQYMGFWMEKAGLRDELQWKDARGTAATNLLRSGLELDEIAVHMGWSIRFAANVIEHYATVDPDRADDILIKLDAARAKRAGASAGDEA